MTKMTQAELQDIAVRSGLTLTADTQQELLGVMGILEGMIARVSRPKPRESEPAVIFVPDQHA